MTRVGWFERSTTSRTKEKKKKLQKTKTRFARALKFHFEMANAKVSMYKRLYSPMSNTNQSVRSLIEKMGVEQSQLAVPRPAVSDPVSAETKSESVALAQPTVAAMAGRHSFALLAEFEENDIPRLKNTLTKYFQSKKSCGGECEVDHDSGSGRAVVRFLKQEGKRRRCRGLT